MDEAGVASRHIMRISRHKSEASIKNYSNRLSDKKKREISDCLSNSLSNNTSIASVQNQNLNETVRNATVSVPPTENVISIGNSSVNAIQDMEFFSSDIQALFDNDFELEDIVLPVISHTCNHDNSSMVPTNTNINCQVRNVNEYNYSAGPNVLNTYQNNMATFPQNVMPNISNNNCTVNFNFYSK
jgi:hypothetical protein